MKKFKIQKDGPWSPFETKPIRGVSLSVGGVVSIEVKKEKRKKEGEIDQVG